MKKTITALAAASCLFAFAACASAAPRPPQQRPHEFSERAGISFVIRIGRGHAPHRGRHHRYERRWTPWRAPSAVPRMPRGHGGMRRPHHVPPHRPRGHQHI